jgi:DNA-binding PadR family transcriptional regulator
MGSLFATPTELIILYLLKDAPAEMHGLELVKASGGLLKRGTIYVTLGRMEEKGMVISRTRQDGQRPVVSRPVYKVTALGERALVSAELMSWKPLGRN